MGKDWVRYLLKDTFFWCRIMVMKHNDLYFFALLNLQKLPGADISAPGCTCIKSEQFVELFEVSDTRMA